MGTILAVREKDRSWKQTLVNQIKLAKKHIQAESRDVLAESETSLKAKLFSGEIPHLKTESFVLETVKNNWSTTLNRFAELLDSRISMLNQIK